MSNSEQPAYPCYWKGNISSGEILTNTTAKNPVGLQQSYEGVYGGLTKRELIAAMAMQGILSNQGLDNKLDEKNMRFNIPTMYDVAKYSLLIADELLKQLSNPKTA